MGITRNATREEKIQYKRQWRASNLKRCHEWESKHRQKNREKFNIYRKEYSRLNPEKQAMYVHRSNLKRKFGMTIEQYNELFNIQKGCCRICGRHQSTLVKKLHVDHCHKTGAIRGLLCVRCNNALGMFKDDLQILQAAIDYLKQTQ